MRMWGDILPPQELRLLRLELGILSESATFAIRHKTSSDDILTAPSVGPAIGSSV